MMSGQAVEVVVLAHAVAVVTGVTVL